MSKKKNYYPDFYNQFKCIAEKCPDSCCKEWDVVVDDKSFEFYSALPDNSIANNIVIDEDGDRVFVMRNNACPFWNSEKLCDIYKMYGEEHICETCKSFPRICQDYTEFSEYLLSIACYEACRMIISSKDAFSVFTIEKTVNQTVEYSNDYMNFLLSARRITAEFFLGKTDSFTAQLKRCILFTEYVQSLLDDECFDTKVLLNYVPESIRPEKKSRKFVFEMHNDLDIIDNKWLEELLSSADSILCNTEQTDSEYRNIALYYIYRYYLTAVDSYDVVTTIKRLYCVYVVCSAMTAKQNAENNKYVRTLILQRYSKEIEHSDENSSRLTEIFMYDSNFLSKNLLLTL